MTSISASPTGFPAAKFTWRDALFLLLWPIAAWCLFDINPWNQKDYVDPWYYTGCGQVFEQLVAHYGWPYYYIRFPVVFLNTLFCSGNDPATGYLLLRYLLLVAAGGATYLMALQRYSRSIAVFSSIFLFCEPIVLRNILWDYPPFVSLMTALTGIMLWEIEGRLRWLRVLGAGALFCTALNSNVFISTLIGCYGLALIGHCALSKRGWGRLGAELMIAAAGFAGVLFAGVLYLKHRVPAFDARLLWTVTVDALRAGNSYALAHSSDFSSWGKILGHVYVPFLFTGAGWIIAWRNFRQTRELVLLVTATLYCVFFTWYGQRSGQFVFHTFYYFAHLALVSHLIAPLVAGSVERRAGARWTVGAAAAAALIFSVWFAILKNKEGFTGTIIPATWGWLTVVAALVLGAMVLGRVLKQHVMLLFATVLFFATINLLDLSHPTGRFIYYNRLEAQERECFEIGVKYARVWGRHAELEGKQLVWFNRSDRVPDLFALTFVTLCDALSEKWGNPEGLPNIGEYELKRLHEPGYRRIIVLATDPLRIEAGKKELEAHGLQLSTLEKTEIASGSFRLHVEVLTYQIP